MGTQAYIPRQCVDRVTLEPVGRESDEVRGLVWSAASECPRTCRPTQRMTSPAALASAPANNRPAF